MAETEALRGKVLDINIQDSPEDSEKEWRRFSFKIYDHEGGSTRWYSWFSERGGTIRTGKSYHFSITVKPGKGDSDKEFYNIEELIGEIEPPAGGTSQAPGPAPAATNGDRNQFNRSKEEMRWTESVRLAVDVVGTGLAVDLGMPRDSTDEHQDHETTMLFRAGIEQWTPWFYEYLQHGPEAEVPVVADAPPAEEAKGKATTAKKATPAKADAVPDANLQDLKDLLAGDGMTWGAFEVEVTKCAWETFTQKRKGTVTIALKLYATYRETHPVGAAA